MADYSKILKGDAVFLLGWFITAITGYIIGPIMTLLGSDCTTFCFDSTVEGIIWTMLILVWTLSMVIVPIALVIMGLTETETKKNILDMVGAGLFSFFTLAFVYVTYGWVETFTSWMTYDIALISFWIGYAGLVIINAFGIPIYIAIKSRQE